jgi:hypothetical protein
MFSTRVLHFSTSGSHVAVIEFYSAKAIYIPCCFIGGNSLMYIHMQSESWKQE